MKILHIIPTMSTRYGGPVKACREMASAVMARGHDVRIFTTDYDGFGGYDPDPGASLQDGVPVRTFPIDVPPAYFRVSRAFVRALRQAMAEIDLVHIHSLYLFTTLAGGYYARRFNVPFILRPHGSLDPFLYPRHRGRKLLIEHLYQNRLFRQAAAIHFTTAEEQRLAAPHCFKRPFFVIPLGLNIADYRPLPERGAFRRLYPEIGEKPVLLFFSRLNFKKGLDILARAFGEIARRRDDVHLVVAGPDNDGLQREVEGWLAREGVLDRTTFTGMVTGAAKLAVLHDADLFILPSYTENFGISVVEAMACQLPVLISDKVNIWREVKASGAGEVEPLDPGRFAARSLAMLDDPAALHRYGQSGERAVSRLFDWESIGARLERAYAAAIAGQPFPGQTEPDDAGDNVDRLPRSGARSRI